ncbi:DUF1467 family protein [Frigidibacter sp. ROC022]|uniref:DUF1467 family protein n=1 Tax=Frigidibacter sp. ROC022 TaxID=2971796 RepID=UPI00215A73F7|nr:DUF1467 family protein [Frigidibacter sp. ROC022]MCR8726241.1 DUF1467 family protein [Frigidibacter sp. ROC022]
MNPFTATLLYLGIWFLTVFVVLPIGLRTQGDDGSIVPGTHAGAPANYRFRRMFLRVTIVATVIWALIVYMLLFTDVSVHDIDFFHRMDPPKG